MKTWIARLAAVALLLVAASASAQNTYSTYIDSDGNPGTGCTIALPGGMFTGADYRLQATVTPGTAPVVSAVRLSACSGGAFGAGTQIAGPYPVGTNNGTAGSDVIEMSVPQSSVLGGQSTVVHFGFAAQDATGSDVLFTTTGTQAGGPIQIAFAFPIPTIGLGAMVALGVLMLWIGRRFGRAKLLARTLGASLLALSGIVLAANFIVDGQVGDWAGVPPAAADPTSDPTNGSPAIDIRVAFIATEGNTLFFRIDIAELQNQPPTANPVTVTTNEDTPVTITLNGSDPEGAPLTFAIASSPTKGTLGAITPINATSASVTYTPSLNANGADSFTYTSNDGQTNSAPATVSITITPVDDPPAAMNDSATVNEDSSANAIDVLANDTDVDVGPKSVASVTQPTNGTVAITGGGTGVSYTPNANYCNNPPGTTLDTFTYTLTPGASTATVSVTVTCVDDPPVTVADAAMVNEDSGATAIDVLANDTDIDAGPKSVASVTQPANGVVVITGGGTGLTYAPNANYCNAPPGTTLDTFTYTLAPGSSSTTVTVTVTCVDDPPVAVNDSATVTEDDPATAINVLANDTDIDGGPKSVAAVTQPANGTVVITGGGTGLTYQPAPNYCNAPPGTSPDTFTYTLNGGSTATVSVTVTCVDDPATAANDAATVTEDDPATAIPVLANDTDPDGGPAPTINGVTQPANGVVVITGGGTGLTYAPNANYCNNPPGTTLDTFTYTIGPVASTATVTMTVTCVDDPPVAVADSATVLEDSGATAVPVLTNDTDIDAGPKSIASVTQPANGVVVITGGGTGLTYAANANYCNAPPGTTLDTFTYTLTPGSSSTTVTMTVTCVDDPPVAVNDAATLTEDDPATAINVLANDTDVDGGPKSIASVTQPANGVVVITGGGTGLTYQPNANYCNNPPGTAPDTFTYTLNGGSVGTVSATVNCVDDAPVAVNDAATVTEDSGANSINVLANDTDLDGGPKSITSVTQPANGVIVITGGGTGLTYAPNANYCNNPPGTTLDTFTYTLTPGGSSATVTMTVTCVDDPPVAVNDAATVTQGSGANAINVLANDTDVDGGPKSVQSVTQPANGAVVITGGGTGLTYQPNVGYCNNPPGTTPDTFTYTLNGGSTATVRVLVTCDTPPTAVNDSATVVEDSGATAVNVLANDTDPDGGPKSIASVTQPANGVVVITGGGTGLTYQPNANYCNNPPGTTLDTFTYTLTPGGSTATVTMTVTCVDDPPVAVNDSATLTEDDPATAINVLANDTDIDGGPKTVNSVTQPANGAVVITGGGTGLTYQPNANYCNNPPGTTLDTFAYTLNGGSSATVTVTVTCVDDPPVANNDAATVLEDAAATAVPVLANDTDPDGPALSIQSVTQPGNGIVVITGGGAGLTYAPNANYCNNPPGTTLDTFTYTLAGGGSATVTMTVSCVDDPPVAVNDAATVNEDSGATAIPVLTNDTDVDGGPKTIGSVTQPTNGAVVITGGGTGLTYAPNANYCNNPPGTTLDTFTYTLNGGSIGTVTMTVTCINDAPTVANAPSYNVFTNIAINQPDDATNDLLGSARGISDPDFGGPFTIAAASLGPRATVQGGSIIIAANGSFTYNPPLNFTGGDSVTYQVCDNGTPLPPACTTVTITFTVAGLAIVFVDDSAAAGGNGTLLAPVQTVAAGIAALASGGGSSNIFLFSGAYPQTVTQVLPNNLRIFGQGSGVASFDTLYTIAPPALSIARPALSQPRPIVSSAIVACMTLGQNNSLRGFEIGPCVTDALVGTNFGTLTVAQDNMVLNNTTGRALSLTTGTGAATFASITSTGSATQGVNLSAVSGSLTVSGPTAITNPTGTGINIVSSAGAITFSTTTVSKTPAGIGVNLGGAGTGNSGAITFDSLGITTSAGAALVGTENTGTVTVTNNTASISATGGPAINITKPAAPLSPLTLNLGTVSSSASPTQAINLAFTSGTVTATGGTLQTAAGTTFAIGNATASSGGTVTVTYPGAITQTTGAAPVVIQNSTGGTRTFSGQVTATSGGALGISLLTNPGSTINFTGGINLSTAGNPAFTATGGGTVSATQNNGAIVNTLTTTTGAALNVANTNIGAAGLTFRSISAGTGAGSAGVGISLDNTGASGGLTISGNATPASGGTIQHKTGADLSTTAGIGIFLKDTQSTVLNRMQLNDFDNSAIVGRNVNGFTLNDSVINGVIGTSSVPVEGAVMFGLVQGSTENAAGANGLQGTGIIHNTKITGSVEHNLEFYNNSGTMNLTIDGTNAVGATTADCEIKSNSAAFGGDGVQMEVRGGTQTITVRRCLFDDNKSQAVQVTALGNSNTTATIDQSKILKTTQGNEGFVLSNGADAHLNAFVTNNIIGNSVAGTGVGGAAIFVGQGPGNATTASDLRAEITGNTIFHPTSATNTAVIALLTSTVGQIANGRVLISGNTITENSTSGVARGILVDTPDANTTPVFDATVLNNSVSVGDNVAGVVPIVVQSRRTSAPASCANIGSNSATFPNGNPGVAGVRARQVAPGALNIEQTAACTGTSTAVLACRNPAATTEVLGTVGTVAQGTCKLPSDP